MTCQGCADLRRDVSRLERHVERLEDALYLEAQLGRRYRGTSGPLNGVKKRVEGRRRRGGVDD